jgi:pilus assembly protein FimV
MARETQSSPASEKKLEQYGVWVKVKPREVTEAPPLEESFELSDLESPRTSGKSLLAKAEQSVLTTEEENLLNELETELAPEEAGESVLVPDEEPLLAESELPDIEPDTGTENHDIALGQPTDEELPELEEDGQELSLEPVPAGKSAATHEASEIEVTLSEDIAEKDHFNDLEALESELASVTTKRRDSSASSAEILSRIEEELRSIRTDLTQLRGELSGLRASAAETSAQAETVEQAAPGGFFDEDEDETIALTGDELDNILNTAEITEEVVESPAAVDDSLTMELGEEPSAPQADILSYETLSPEETPPTREETAAEESALATAATDETLILTDDTLPAIEETTEESAITEEAGEELPAELELDEPAAASDAVTAAAFPEIDLEGIPELEEEQPAAMEAPAEVSADEENETIDLETLDLGEEPTVVNAVAEQVEDLEALADLEPIPPASSDSAEKSDIDAEIEALADEVDLEALAAEAQELEDEVPVAPKMEDMEILDFESPEETSKAAPPEEVEISFEGDLEQDAEALAQLAKPVAEPEEQLLEAEEAESAPAAAGKAAPSAGIPDNMKDEIRTVLKYMDHLLEALPDEKIQEFASSDYFVMYKKLFEDLGLGE